MSVHCPFGFSLIEIDSLPLDLALAAFVSADSPVATQAVQPGQILRLSWGSVGWKIDLPHLGICLLLKAARVSVNAIVE